MIGTLKCEHCGHNALNVSDALGVDEHCNYCGLSIFISGEEIITDNLNIKDKMKTTKLFELLVVVEHVYSRTWEDVMELVVCIGDNQIEATEKKWADRYKQDAPQHFPLDLSNIKTWSTYEGCTDLNFYTNGDKFLCDARVYNGELLDGHRTDLRFTATIELPYSYLQTIKDKIMYAVEKLATVAYEDHLLAVERKWKENYKLKVFGIEPEK